VRGKAMDKEYAHIIKTMCDNYAAHLYSTGWAAFIDYFYIMNHGKFKEISYPILNDNDFMYIYNLVWADIEKDIDESENDIPESQIEEELKRASFLALKRCLDIDQIYKINIHEPISFIELFARSNGLVDVYTKVSKQVDSGEIDIITFKLFAQLNETQKAILAKYSELMGYWTARIEKRKNNPGGLAMRKRGERNTKAIEDVLNKLGIKNIGIFRKDKRLRNSFFDMAKKLTDLESEDRILKIARQKVKASLDRQNKP
jgi:hypothetical protein